MSEIKQAISNLRSEVGRLEMALHGLQTSMAGKQRDMFAEMSAKAGKNIDNTVIAQRLDKAIKKVEELLDA